MATTRFIIRNYTNCLNKDGTTPIFLRYSHQAKSTILSTGIAVLPKHRAHSGQRINNACSGHTKKNAILSQFRQKVESVVHDHLLKEVEPTAAIIKDVIRNHEKEDNSSITLFKSIDQYITNARNEKVIGTIKCYLITLNHLREFERRTRTKLTWESIDLDFYQKFKKYYINDLGNGINSFGKNIKNIKVFMRDGIEKGYHGNMKFTSTKFQTPSEEVESIYLNETELKYLFDLDLSMHPRLERALHLFLVGAYTGLRFSDFNSIQPENLQGDFIKITTQKTGRRVVIPKHPIVESIMAKYPDRPNHLPPTISNQKMNQFLKEIGQIAEFNEDIVITRSRGGKRVKQTFKKWELMKTHCARRSFATNMFKQGFPSLYIMKITGHKTEKMFLKYIKFDEEEAAEMLKKHWEQYHLKQKVEKS